MASGAPSGAPAVESSALQVPPALRARYAAGGQAHVFRFLDAGVISRDAGAALVAQLEAIDVPLVNELFAATMAAAAAPPAAGALAPCRDVTVLARAPRADADAWRARALAAIAAGQLAALVLAGGQGTRLGSARPKGEYDVGLPSGRSLFALQAARVQRLRVLARAAAGGAPGAPLPSLPLYVMTSPMTDADTRACWAGADYFGLPRGDVVFFSQGTLPCVAPDGAFILESGGAVAEAPDGNGGIYRALHTSGVVADLAARGVRGVHVFAVDNAIVRPADPAFLGFCLARDADVGSKVCAKAGPHEKVGVLCEVGGVYSVVEYSEMPREAAERRGADGALEFNTGNLCIHYYSTAFLAGPCSPAQLPKVYHLAKKSIPCADAVGATMDKAAMAAAFGAGGVNGIKLESFIFDVFPAARRMAVLEIERDAEFAPVKNAPGSAEDSPDTARALIARLHARWLRDAGATLLGDGAVEVSGAASYAGEGLAALAGRALQTPLLVRRAGEHGAAAAREGVTVVELDAE